MPVSPSSRGTSIPIPKVAPACLWNAEVLLALVPVWDWVWALAEWVVPAWD